MSESRDWLVKALLVLSCMFVSGPNLTLLEDRASSLAVAFVVHSDALHSPNFASAVAVIAVVAAAAVIAAVAAVVSAAKAKNFQEQMVSPVVRLPTRREDFLAHSNLVILNH